MSCQEYLVQNLKAQFWTWNLVITIRKLTYKELRWWWQGCILLKVWLKTRYPFLGSCSRQGIQSFSPHLHKTLTSFNTPQVQEADILLAQSVRIIDKFEFSAQERLDEESDVTVTAQGSCSSFTGVVIAGALFLAAQLVMLMAWSYMWHKKRATKQIDPTPPNVYFGTTSSRTSSTSYLAD